MKLTLITITKTHLHSHQPLIITTWTIISSQQCHYILCVVTKEVLHTNAESNIWSYWPLLFLLHTNNNALSVHSDAHKITATQMFLIKLQKLQQAKFELTVVLAQSHSIDIVCPLDAISTGETVKKEDVSTSKIRSPHQQGDVQLRTITIQFNV